jgi:hypothetical protein
MANFAKLNEEEIKIEIESSKTTPDYIINILLRNPKREDFKYTINTNIIKTIKHLKNEVINYYKKYIIKSLYNNLDI